MKQLLKLDAKDKRLLAELDANSRASLSELAKKIHLSREAVNYRIKRLFYSRYIKKFVTNVDYMRLGYTIYSLYFKFGILTEKEEIEVIQYLKNLPDMNWAAAVSGRFDFVLEFPAKNVWEFMEKREEILKKYPGKLITHEVAIFTNQQKMNKRYLYPIPDKIDEYDRVIEKIDQKDEMILDELKNDARMSLSEISNRIKLPASTVAKRISDLKKRHIIRDFTLHMDHTKVNYRSIKACIKMAEYSDKTHRQIIAFCEQNPNVAYYISCIGRWDYEIDFEVENREQYRQYLREIRNMLGTRIQEIETLDIFTTYKFSI